MNFFKPKFWDKNQISIYSILLLPISLLINFINFLKSYLIKVEKCSIPVICVGNIYLGGTGKTPLCIEIFSILKNLNMNPSFIRKKYNAYQDEVILQKKIGSVYQSNKRILAIKEAIQNKSDVAVLDDGFQDFSINKNLSIICFNSKQWIGNGLIIPSGPLRESINSLKRANCIVINGDKNLDIENEILKQNKNLKIFYTKYIPLKIDSFKNKKITAFAGIGNPENFFDLLKGNNINVVEKLKFPDHYNYSNKDLKNLIDKAQYNNTVLLTTEKDYFRINENFRKKINFLKISLQINNKEKFIEEIKKII
jgi:tetraacyldisaccharide 4'-kinase